MTFPLTPISWPRPANGGRVSVGLSRWRDRAADLDDKAVTAFAAALADDPGGRAMLEAIFGGSPYLTDSLVREIDFVSRLMQQGPDEAARQILADLVAEQQDQTDTASLMKALRIAKRRLSLTAALADIGGVWPLEKVTFSLSDLATTGLCLAARHVLAKAHQAGDLVLPHPENPEFESGLIVLGMGKLGAGELNYSSDIDIIVFYDDEKMTYTGRRSLPECMVRLTRDMVKILDERTTDGYVFRTDLRLRPDPASTPAAISVLAAEIYYESLGQNWERAAMIKARPLAGDLAAGESFLTFLRPFIWRKYLDFAAIQDIHSIKRQIDAHRGNRTMVVPGHNVKLGRGGIREIEFFAQTQQLIWGGRQPELRDRQTCVTLDELAQLGHTDQNAATDLKAAYGFLRRIEHRLQMVGDRQTQEMPTKPDELEEFALFAGYDSTQALSEDLLFHLRKVEEHYAGLFAQAPSLSVTGLEDGGNLVFTGTDEDPETLRTLTRLGFSNPPAVAAEIRGWHHGRVRATRSTRARELLTELTPALLAALGRTSDPDQALIRFAGFLARLPAGIALFSLFHANPQLLDLLAEIMGNAPRLAEHLARHPSLLDNVLTEQFFDAPPGPETLAADLDRALALARDFQEVLDISRRWANDHKFQVGVLAMKGRLSEESIGAALTDIADVVVQGLMGPVEDELARLHGRIPGGEVAVVALGKMGSREMTATSDLDVITVYWVPEGTEDSDGAKPIDPTTWFARFTQRMVNAISAKTAEGALYEVDMRLRPSGNAGPVASSLDAFERYHREAAWTWEHMALTRARVVAAPPDLRQRIEDRIQATLAAPRDGDRLLVDVWEMRERMARDLKSDTVWDVKLRRGGLVDIDFIAQYLLLRHASAHPELIVNDMNEVLRRAANLGLIRDDQAQTLLESRRLWSIIQHVLRQTITGGFKEDTASVGLKQVLSTAAGLPSYSMLVETMNETAQACFTLFEDIIANPARAAKASLPPAPDTK